MSIYLSGAFWIIGAGVAAALVAVLIHRIPATVGLSGNNEVAGQVFTIVAGLHAVLLAFVLISLFDGVSAAQSDSQREANNLVAVSWSADALPEPVSDKVRQITMDYSNTVVSQEWPQMSDQGTVEATAGWQQLEQLRDTIAKAPTSADDTWQESRKAAATDQLWEVYQARQARLDAAGSGGVSSVVWFALLLGSVMVMGLIYLHGGPKVLSHALISGTLAAAITLLLFAIYQLQNPFSGGAAVGPDAFTAVLDRLN
ncbi:DUF4239 domain-containing protein [Kibdelosporangium philippinense]|uniref:DUF4239 domain-containing protein n=1 Tax=Kibdelosporangium philippinense TaxID=211113 RepID=A0ABS8ZPK2_9PSEU|nr:DUF4239 domain-containing protein [Kibdelosporangium philippinense]MCE7009676.1 DUF4239 domain-containing protein [Kibdelosporangium philippinense]